MLSCRPTGIHAAFLWHFGASPLGLFLIVKASNERAALVQSAFLALNISGSGYLSESEMEPFAICTGISSCIQCILFLCLTWDLGKFILFSNINARQTFHQQWNDNTHAYQLYFKGLPVTKFGCFELFEMGWIVCLWVGSFSCQTQVCLGQSRSGGKSLICWERNASKLHETVRDIIFRKLLGSQRRKRSIVCERFSVSIRPLATK